MKPLRPFFPYYGSKWSLAKKYPSPQHDILIEPFAGSAGYATYYNHPRVMLIDADPIIVGVWQYLIQASPEQILDLPDLPNVGDSVDDHDLSDGAKWLIGFWINRGSSTPAKSRTAYSARTDRSQLIWGPKAKRRIADQLQFIRGWEARIGSYEDAPDIEATWLIDPPYADKGKYYRVKFNDFAGLGRWSTERKGLVVVCEGPDADWLPFQPLGEFKTTKGKSKESLFVSSSAQ